MLGRTLIYILFSGVVLSVLVLTYEIAHINVVQNTAAPVLHGNLNVSSESWIIADLSSGDVVSEKNADEMLPIASITKLFTAHAALQSPHIDEKTRITWSDLSGNGRAGKLSYGEEYTLRELMFPLLLESSNDASNAILRTLGEDEFNSSVTKLENDIGLTKTAIADSSGLSTHNVSTARELIWLLSFLKVHEEHILDITRLRQYINHKNGWVNNNPARLSSHFMGGKHGYTGEADSTFAGLFTTTDTNQTYAVVLLKSDDLAEDLVAVESYLFGK